MKQNAWIYHGTTTHSLAKRRDCLDCIDVEIEFLKELKKAGGQTNFLEQQRKEIK